MRFKGMAAAIGLIAAGLLAGPAAAFDIGIVAFQMSSETHARVANAAKAAAEAKGWKVTLLNSAGAMPEHAAQIENLIQAKVGAIIIAAVITHMLLDVRSKRRTTTAFEAAHG